MQQFLRALHTLWQHPSLEGPLSGPYATHTPALTPTALPSRLENMSSLYGALHLPQGRAVGCLSMVMCPGTEPVEEISAYRACWVLLCIPIGMLESIYPVEYPLAANSWIDPLDRLLVEIGEMVYRAAPFELAVIGEEAAASEDAEPALTAERLAQGGYLVSPHIAAQLKPTRVPETCPSGLLWFP